jgi:hypothetical protein
VNFVDPIVRKGYRFAGTALVLERGSAAYAALFGRFRSALASPMRHRDHQGHQGAGSDVASLRTVPKAAAEREV